MNIIDDIKLISFLKQKTSEVVNRVKTNKQPTFITINGNVELVIQDAESYQKMMDSVYLLSENDISKIKAGLKEVKEGKVVPADEFFKKIGDKYVQYKIFNNKFMHFICNNISYPQTIFDIHKYKNKLIQFIHYSLEVLFTIQFVILVLQLLSII